MILFDFLVFFFLCVDTMDNVENLRQMATERLMEVNGRVEDVFNFVEGALTLQQLDHVIDLMDNCFVNAQFILNQPQPPQPLDAVDDNMDAESGTTD